MNDMERRCEVVGQVLSGSPGADRLRLCGKIRDHRGDLFRCNRPPCAKCGELAGNRFARRTVLPLARIARECGYTHHLVTVILPPSSDIDDAGGSLAWAKRAIKDRLLRLGDRCEGWWMAGGYEMDVVRDDQFDLLGARKRETLGALNFPHANFGAAVWLPHLHLVLALPPGVDRDLVRDTLITLFPEKRQVEMKPIRGNGHDESGLRRAVRYPFKHMVRLALPADHAAESWDAEEVTTYQRWAERLSGHGYRGLRFISGDRRFLDLVVAALDAEEEADRRAICQIMAEDEWLHGPGSDVENDGEGGHLGRFGVPQGAVSQGDSSSSNGGVYTTTATRLPEEPIAFACGGVRRSMWCA